MLLVDIVIHLHNFRNSGFHFFICFDHLTLCCFFHPILHFQCKHHFFIFIIGVLRCRKNIKIWTLYRFLLQHCHDQKKLCHCKRNVIHVFFSIFKKRNHCGELVIIIFHLSCIFVSIFRLLSCIKFPPYMWDSFVNQCVAKPQTNFSAPFFCLNPVASF